MEFDPTEGSYSGPERRKNPGLSETDRALIAQEVYRLLWADVYEDTGRTAFKALKLLAWAGGLSLLAWAVATGKITKIGE